MSKILLLPLQNFTVLYFFALCAIIAVICVCAFLSAAIHLRTPLHEKEGPDVKTVQRILLWILFVVVLCAALIGGVFWDRVTKLSVRPNGDAGKAPCFNLCGAGFAVHFLPLAAARAGRHYDAPIRCAGFSRTA